MGKHKPGKGRATKKARSGLKAQGNETADGPSTFVFHRGKVSKNVHQLVNDMRRLMEPSTASHLKTHQKNVMKDFVCAAGDFNVSHLVAFTQTEKGIYMRLVRMPRGPTITFQICSYSLSRDVTSAQKDPHMDPKQFLYHPLVIMNNFRGEGMEFKLMASMFQNMFPSINVGTVKLNHLKRCVVINYNSEDGTVDLTQCNIQISPAGVSRPIKKLVKAKVPNMSKFSDISDYVTRDGNLSESEAELDGPANEVTLPQKVSSRGNIASTKSAIRMNEIGPRITMKLYKIEEGVCDGAVLYHSIFSKSEEEIQRIKEERQKKQKVKAQRRKNQEENVRKKATVATKKTKAKAEDKNDGYNDDFEVVPAVAEDKGDEEYFQEEVGVAPDPELFSKNKKRKSGPELGGSYRKRMKFSKNRESEQKDGKQRYSEQKDGKQRYGKQKPQFKNRGQSPKNFNKNKKRFSKK